MAKNARSPKNLNSMSEYFSQWFHIYLIHFGAWVSFMFATSIYKSGLPDVKALPNMFKVVVILSVFLSAFSSHSHNHWLTHFNVPAPTTKGK